MTSTADRARLAVSLVAADRDPRYLALDAVAGSQLFGVYPHDPELPDRLAEMVATVDGDCDFDGRVYRCGYTDDWDVEVTVGSVRPFGVGPWILVESRAVVVDGQGCEIYTAGIAEHDLAGMLADFDRLVRELTV